MLKWFVPENMWIVIVIAVMIGLVTSLIIRKKNNEYLQSENKLGQSEQVLRLYKKAKSNCDIYPLRCPLAKDSINRGCHDNFTIY